jgi:hypothetical protein
MPKTANSRAGRAKWRRMEGGRRDASKDLPDDRRIAAMAAMRKRAAIAKQYTGTGRLSPVRRSAEIPSIKKTVSQRSGRAGIEFPGAKDYAILIQPLNRIGNLWIG